MAINCVDVSTLTVAGTSIGLDSASPTKAAAWLSGARQALIVVEGAPVYMRSDGDAATSADILLNAGDIVPILGDSMNQAMDNLRFIRKTSTSATLKIIWYNREAVLTERIIRGAVSLVTEAGDSIIDDTADAVKVLPVNAAGAELAKAEDAAHTSADKGYMALAVREDGLGSNASATGDYTHIQTDRLGKVKVSPPSLFGTPFLAQGGNGFVRWEKARNSGNMQHSVFGWMARLYGGGTNDGDDWAAIEIPVADMPLNKLASIALNYNMAADETYSIGVMITITDPNERDSRAELSLYTAATGGHTPPDSAAGHNYYEVLPASTGYFWYGENCTGAVLTEGLPNIYTIAQFQADAAFSTYVITKIEINTGWAGSGKVGTTWLEAMTINGEPIPLKPTADEVLSQVYEDVSKALKVRTDGWLFGEPTLHFANNSAANWCQGIVSPLDQKSTTGWLADLYGGVQTGDDWARINIPVNEMPLSELSSALWSYYMTTADYMGVGMVIWVHDPDDNDIRAELTQDALDVQKAAAWNAHELATTDHFFYYGEITGTPDTCPTAGTHYTLAQFQSDSIFATYTIYRITLEFGWGAAGNTFGDAYVADVKINGEVIPLKPDKTGTGRIAQRLVSVDTGAVAFSIAPKTPYRLLSMDVHASAVLDTGEVLTLTKDAGAGTFFDSVILSDDLFIGSRTSEHYAFGVGYEFPAEDEIDLAQANGSNDDLGITIIYQTVF